MPKNESGQFQGLEAMLASLSAKAASSDAVTQLQSNELHNTVDVALQRTFDTLQEMVTRPAILEQIKKFKVGRVGIDDSAHVILGSGFGMNSFQDPFRFSTYNSVLLVTEPTPRFVLVNSTTISPKDYDKKDQYGGGTGAYRDPQELQLEEAAWQKSVEQTFGAGNWKFGNEKGKEEWDYLQVYASRDMNPRDLLLSRTVEDSVRTRRYFEQTFLVFPLIRGISRVLDTVAERREAEVLKTAGTQFGGLTEIGQIKNLTIALSEMSQIGQRALRGGRMSADIQPPY